MRESTDRPTTRTLASLVTTTLVALAAGACSAGNENPPEEALAPVDGAGPSIDQRSYRLGSIGAFAEMVDAGVKELALSAAVDPDEMDAMVEEATRIAAGHDVEVFRETEFLVTDLFSTDLTEGKHVLLIYRGTTRQKYMDLKGEKARLESLGQYEGENRARIARQIGALLSYSDEKIEELLANQGIGL